jgi:hypothetical protein
LTLWILRSLFLITPISSLLTIVWNASVMPQTTGRKFDVQIALLYWNTHSIGYCGDSWFGIIRFLLFSRLQCEPSGKKPSSWSACPAMQCEGGLLTIGNTTTSGCNTTTCAYAGFSGDQNIFTALATQSTCPVTTGNCSQ